MANDFSGDANCKALYNMESGNLTVDSKGTNTLTDNNTVTEDTVKYKQGSCSAFFDDDNSESLSITDANLNSGFPLKLSGSATISICFWMYYVTGNRYFLSKYHEATGKGGIIGRLLNTTANLTFYLFDTSLASYLVSSTSTLTGNRWYHVGFTYDSSDQSYRLRIWDDTAQALLEADVTGTSDKVLAANGGPLYLGKSPVSSAELDGNLDEVVFFSDVLTVDEIDQIRAGTYGAAAPSGIPVFFREASRLMNGGLQ